MATKSNIAKLYSRLAKLGFERAFVRDRLLPDWWDDSLAENPANRAIAEVGLARMLGIEVASLRDDAVALSFPSRNSIKFKRTKGTSIAAVEAAAQLALHVATQIIPALRSQHAFSGRHSPTEVRDAILRRFATVTLDGLLDFAWSQGIVVLHLKELPKRSRKFAGLATFVGEIPVVVLASGRDAPPWIAFHLAHELGHILLGHVSNDGDVIADGDLDAKSDEALELAADRFAVRVLTGTDAPRPGTSQRNTAPDLAAIADFQGRKRQIDPGTLCLLHGREFGRYAVAQAALPMLGRDKGAREAISSALRAHLESEMAESTEAALALVLSD